MDYWAKDIYSWGIFLAEVVLRRDWRCARLSWQCLVFGQGTFSVVRSHEYKNNIFWGSTPPEHCLQRPLHSVKCTTRVAISKHGIIGPFWFEDNKERSVTINTERYVQVLGKFWTALGWRRGVVRVLQCFQQDGATPRTSNESLAWLQQRFPDRLISHRCDPQWSPHSPDLNPPDFYMWEYLKDRVYGNNLQTIPDLKAAIRAIPREECGRVIKSFARRIQMCLQRRGAHLEHIFEHLLSYLSTPGPGIGRLEWKPIRMLIKCVIDITQSSKMTGFFAWFFWILLLDLNHWFWFKSINPGSSSKYLVMYETAIICRRIGWLPVFCVRRTNEGWSRVGR